MSIVTHNTAQQRFETQVDAAPLAYLSYRQSEKGLVFLTSTFVPDELRGRGLAGLLTRTALEEARRSGWRIVPLCSYIASFIEKHPDFADLVAPQSL